MKRFALAVVLLVLMVAPASAQTFSVDWATAGVSATAPIVGDWLNLRVFGSSDGKEGAEGAFRALRTLQGGAQIVFPTYDPHSSVSINPFVNIGGENRSYHHHSHKSLMVGMGGYLWFFENGGMSYQWMYRLSTPPADFEFRQVDGHHVSLVLRW